MKRLLSMIAAGMLSVTVLTACSGGDGSEYCDRFRENAESNKFDDPAAAGADTILTELEEFRDIAPDDLQDDYDTLIAAVEGEAVDPTEAVANIEAYAVDNCDVEVEG